MGTRLQLRTSVLLLLPIFALQGIVPLIAAGIMAGASLLQGLMSQQAAREKEKRMLTFEGQEKGLETAAQGLGNQASAQQNAMDQMVTGFRGSLAPQKQIRLQGGGIVGS